MPKPPRTAVLSFLKGAQEKPRRGANRCCALNKPRAPVAGTACTKALVAPGTLPSWSDGTAPGRTNPSMTNPWSRQPAVAVGILVFLLTEGTHPLNWLGSKFTMLLTWAYGGPIVLIPTPYSRI